MGKRKALRPGTGNLARGRFLPLPGIFPPASDLATSPAALWIEAALLTRLKEALSTGPPSPAPQTLPPRCRGLPVTHPVFP